MSPLTVNRRIPWALWITASLAVLVPTVGAAYWAYRTSLDSLEQRVASMATQLTAHIDDIRQQMMEALRNDAPLPGETPCSPTSMQRMRRSLLRSDVLTDIGYVRNDTLVCSALGQTNIPLGPPAYKSETGYWTRTHLRLPGAEDRPVVAATDPATGLTVFVHDSNAFTYVRGEQSWQLAVVGHDQSDTALARQGSFDQSWLKHAQSKRSGQSVGDHFIVAWQRSSIGDYTVFAAWPRAQWNREWRRSALLLGSCGFSAGLVLMLALIRVAKANASIRSALRRAVRSKQLSLEYQPVVELASGRWVGAEALLRWRRPNGEAVSPAIFIPIAERNGLMPAIRERLIAQFERDTPALFARHPGFHVALNFSAEDFHPDANLATRLDLARKRIGIAPANLHLEATESIFMDATATSTSIEALRKAGYPVSLDDFGTGFSSLSYLTRIRFDCLKIDKAFVDTIGTGAVTSQIVLHIMEMAKSLGIEMIAEGVETPAQAQYLAAHGVRHAQGWLYSKSLPMRELLGQLAKQARTGPSA